MTGERIRVPIPWIKVLVPILGVLWVVGVFYGLSYLPESVHHFFNQEHCYSYRDEEGESHLRCANGGAGWLWGLALALWIGLSAAPFVAVHYFRNWRRKLEERVRRDEQEREWRERERLRE